MGGMATRSSAVSPHATEAPNIPTPASAARSNSPTHLPAFPPPPAASYRHRPEAQPTTTSAAPYTSRRSCDGGEWHPWSGEQHDRDQYDDGRGSEGFDADDHAPRHRRLANSLLDYRFLLFRQPVATDPPPHPLCHRSLGPLPRLCLRLRPGAHVPLAPHARHAPRAVRVIPLHRRMGRSCSPTRRSRPRRRLRSRGSGPDWRCKSLAELAELVRMAGLRHLLVHLALPAALEARHRRTRLYRRLLARLESLHTLRLRLTLTSSPRTRRDLLRADGLLLPHDDEAATRPQEPELRHVLLPIAAVVILALSLWLPWRLYKVVEEEKPKIDGWTELGERRKDDNAEYERLLEADPSPFSFLYCDYRRPWACFRSIYLVVKLINVLLVVLIQKNNCAFRSFSTTYLSVIRQGCLFAFMCLFCILSAFSSPFLDIPSNSSDLVSRLGYVILAMLGLLAAVKIPYTDPATVAVNVVIYGFSAYFIVISKSFVQRWVKRAQRRLDFSIDIFSPHLDLSKHIARRVWQETFAALLLCSPLYAMPPKRKLVFTQDPHLPPYLLDFGGSVSERFVEDLQILRNTGLDAYSDALNDIETDPQLMQLRHRIRAELAGPDVFYRPTHDTLATTSCFGRLDICAFPFVAVFRYDELPDQPLHLNQVDELERLVEQNASTTVVAARKVRLALRALEDQVVFRPHIESRLLGSMGAASVERHISYRFARLRIKHNSTCRWRGYNFSSGFDVSLEYRDGEGVDGRGRLRTGQRLMLSGPQFGVLPDFSLTQDLAKLFRLNRHLIDERLPDVERRMRQHREFFRREADLKSSVLSRGFLLSICGDDCLSTDDINQHLRTTEKNPNIQQMVLLHEATFVRLEERMSTVTSSAVRAWWFLLFDDLWRRNPGLPAACFSPHYSSSICYNPMSRAKLEAFLRERGFSTTSRYAYFHAGFLNQIYFYLEEQVFSPTSRSIPIRLASSPDRLPFEQIHHPHARDGMHSNGVLLSNKRIEQSEVRPSRLTVTTGGGTDEDDRSIRERRAFVFEEIYEQPAPCLTHGNIIAWLHFQVGVKFSQATKVFLGLEPCMRDWRPSEDEGIMLDLRRGRGGWEAPRLRMVEQGKAGPS
ncbi:hypothetical protein AAT19DRAFT_11042 [Rhodotorula toruloides]|uniref:Uncharacterized protein n=1 Tax=Rhodotorula toruloides TaxID=5286 RepID=A0A2S9ZYQ1_RHOTO|nr:hypothetical protein AAT19DRAFT_11042 [Rhodotorula toruloides]